MDLLVRGSKTLGLDLSHKDVQKFKKYKELLKEWNKKINITAITEDDEIDIKHFLDSLTPWPTNLFNGKKKVIDIGTGGGFPGVPLKIVNEDLDITLLDSLNKRINFLKEVILALDLEGVQAVHGRAEELSRKKPHRESFDITISRAVASLDTLSEYCIPFVKVGGYFISMKGSDIEEELQNSLNAINTLGGKLIEKKIVQVPESDIQHSLIIIEKVRHTPSKYPRGGGHPRKNPL